MIIPAVERPLTSSTRPLSGTKGRHRCLSASAHVVLRMLTVRRKLYRTHAAMSDQAGGGPASST